MIVCRGELCCLASTERKREKQIATSGDRKAIGRRADLIIRDTASGIPTEYSAAEVANKFEGEFSEKWASEAKLKLPKMLRDMFVQLADKARWQEDVVHKLQTIGYIHGGK